MNRYDNILRKNQEILGLLPANETLKNGLAAVVDAFVRNRAKTILELGIGDGDLTKRILEKIVR